MGEISDFVTVQWSPASTPAATSPTWVDITAHVQEVTIDGGRSGVFDLYGPRTCTITARNGLRSPVVAPVWDVNGFYRWRQVRVLHVTSGVPLFRGYILTVEHDQTNAPAVGEVTISCTDLMGLVAMAEFEPGDTFGTTVNGFTNCVQLTGALENTLTQAGMSTSWATTGLPSEAWFKLPDEPSGQVLSWLQSVMEAESSWPLQQTTDGFFRAPGRWWVFDLFNPGAQMTLSDTPTGVEVPYLQRNLRFASTDEYYYNRAITKSAHFDYTHTVENIPSGYPAETISRTDLPFVFDGWTEANATLYAALYAETFTFPRSVTVFVASHAAATSWASNVATVSGYFGGFLVVVKHTPVGDTQQTFNVTVESARHTITPDIWTCEFGFASLDRWLNAYGDGSTISALFYAGTSSADGTDIAAP